MFRRLSVLVCGALLTLGCNQNGSAPARQRAATDASDNAAHNEPVTADDSAAEPHTAASDGHDPTNTGLNKRDRDDNAVTADDQSQSSDDVKTSAEIRRAVTADKSLSINAHNVKIIVQDGVVTLRGPVDSEDEKTAVEAEAVRVAGDAKVVNELEVKPTSEESNK